MKKIQKYKIEAFYKPNKFRFMFEKIDVEIEKEKGRYYASFSGYYLLENYSDVKSFRKDLRSVLRKTIKKEAIDVFCFKNGDFKDHLKESNYKITLKEIK